MTTRQKLGALLAFVALGVLLVWRDDGGLDEVVIIWLTVSGLGLAVPYTATFGGLDEQKRRYARMGLIVAWVLWTWGCAVWALGA